MFDVSLTELMVIGVVALIVIGPERLPRVARTAGILLGRLQRYVSDVKTDIRREMQLDELKKMQQQMTEQVRNIESSVTHDMREIESSVDSSIAPPEGVADTGAVPPLVPAVGSMVAPTFQALPETAVGAELDKPAKPASS